MGFGILFLGFLIFSLLPLVGYDVYGNIAAFILFFIALRELGLQNKAFFTAKIITYPLILQSIAKLVIVIMKNRNIGEGRILNFLNGIIHNAGLALQRALLISVMLGIMLLSRQTDIKKLQVWALICLVLTTLNFALQLSYNLFLNDITAYKQLLYNVIAFYSLIYSIIIDIFIFSCYRLICYEGDEDMPQRKPEIGFVRKVQEQQDIIDEWRLERTRNKKEKRQRKKEPD